MLAASLLTEEPIYLSNVPSLADTRDLGKFLKLLGVKIKCRGGEMTLNAGAVHTTTIPAGFHNTTRHSLLTLGPLLARFGEAEISFPAGCLIGNRKFDLHLKGLKKMGAQIELSPRGIKARSERLRGIEFAFYYPTFSGTLNLVFAATLASGETVLRNAALNPEVTDTLCLLAKMGARISGIGTRTLRISGRDRLQGARYRVMADRIELFSLIAVTAITGGHVFIRGGDPRLISAEVKALKKIGVGMEVSAEGVLVFIPHPLRSIDLETTAYPGFHTDNQPLLVALLTRTAGVSRIKETILDRRFAYVPDLVRMGGSIKVVPGNFKCVNGMPGQVAIIKGGRRLQGAEVTAGDIRWGAALLIAALAAHDVSRISNRYQIERGYQDWDKKLNSLGAKIKRE